MAGQAVAAPRYLTEGEKRGLDCQMLRSKIEFYQLSIFHKHFSRDPATLYKELKTCEETLNKLKSMKILKDNDWNLLFPASGLTDSTKFDTTLTCKLIRNLCGYKIPKSGWDKEPESGDITTIADSIRLRLSRNLFQHTPLKITRKEYKDLYKRVESPLVRLGCPPSELKDLRPSFKYNIPNAIPNFIGRDDELTHIHNTFLDDTKPDAVVIVGIPGIGKSELASQYAKMYGGEYDHVIFVNGDSLDTSFKEIAKTLKLDNTTDINVIIQLLKEYFKNEKVLFVYDNVTDTNEIAKFLITNFKSLITTQIQNWGSLYEKIEIEVWTKDQAQQYLATCNLNQHHDQGELEKLADELGYHPLAIEHAISFIRLV